ncbi:MAG: hypothetical protein HYZ42_03715 [Bacteroidetes bacterium]|nr:hypothetical protein [Bacteroidota bacterium]
MKKIVFLSLIIIGFQSCKNDIDVNAPWKETAVIFGLLDMGDSAQYIRVQRIYQNDGEDAIRIAQVGDSLYFDTVVVELTAKNGSSTVWVETLTEDNTIGKDTGMFANSPSVLYKTKRPLNYKYTYYIRVYSPKTGKEYTSSTYLVGPADIVSRPARFVISSTRNYAFTIFAGLNAKAYDVKIRFTYKDYDSITLDSVEHTLDWIAISNMAVSQYDLYPSIVGRSMFDFLAYSIPTKSKIYRKLVACDFHFVGGGEELLNYININKPSLGIIQKKPEYTNVTNGLGLFSSRNTSSIYIPVGDSVNYYLSTDPATKPLNFRYK